MKKILMLTILIGVFAGAAIGQSDETTFVVSVSADSVLFGNKFKVTFTLENAKGEGFNQSAFKDFQQVSGQTTTSRMNVVNGEMSQMSSYIFYLEPKEIGRYFIEPSSIMVDGEVYETMPYEVFVLANPDGLKQEIEEDRRSNNSFFEQFDMIYPPAPNLGSPERKKKEQQKSKRKTTKL